MLFSNARARFLRLVDFAIILSSRFRVKRFGAVIRAYFRRNFTGIFPTSMQIFPILFTARLDGAAVSLAAQVQFVKNMFVMADRLRLHLFGRGGKKPRGDGAGRRSVSYPIAAPHPFLPGPCKQQPPVFFFRFLCPFVFVPVLFSFIHVLHLHRSLCVP